MLLYSRWRGAVNGLLGVSLRTRVVYEQPADREIVPGTGEVARVSCGDTGNTQRWEHRTARRSG
jgi:hypothetical protein